MEATREIHQARNQPPKNMEAGQARGLAMMLARRTGQTNQAALQADVRQFANATGHNPAVSAVTPNQQFLQGEVQRSNTLEQTGHHAAGQGANLTELNTVMLAESARLNMGGPALQSSQRAAVAAIQSRDYQHVQRFTDNTPTGNMSYQGRMRADEGEAPVLTDVPTAADNRGNIGNDRDLDRALTHVAGRGRNIVSPYASVTEHAPSARQTTDQGLRDIIQGTNAGPGAPNLDTFMVPRHALVHPDTLEYHGRRVHGDTTFDINNRGSIRQAQQEHERLYYGDNLDRYRTQRQTNPYRNQG
jgi:hypothetical protein